MDAGNNPIFFINDTDWTSHPPSKLGVAGFRIRRHHGLGIRHRNDIIQSHSLSDVTDNAASEITAMSCHSFPRISSKSHKSGHKGLLFGFTSTKSAKIPDFRGNSKFAKLPGIDFKRERKLLQNPSVYSNSFSADENYCENRSSVGAIDSGADFSSSENNVINKGNADQSTKNNNNSNNNNTNENKRVNSNTNKIINNISNKNNSNENNHLDGISNKNKSKVNYKGGNEIDNSRENKNNNANTDIVDDKSKNGKSLAINASRHSPASNNTDDISYASRHHENSSFPDRPKLHLLQNLTALISTTNPNHITGKAKTGNNSCWYNKTDKPEIKYPYSIVTPVLDFDTGCGPATATIHGTSLGSNLDQRPYRGNAAPRISTHSQLSYSRSQLLKRRSNIMYNNSGRGVGGGSVNAFHSHRSSTPNYATNSNYSTPLTSPTQTASQDIPTSHVSTTSLCIQRHEPKTVSYSSFRGHNGQHNSPPASINDYKPHRNQSTSHNVNFNTNTSFYHKHNISTSTVTSQPSDSVVTRIMQRHYRQLEETNQQVLYRSQQLDSMIPTLDLESIHKTVKDGSIHPSRMGNDSVDVIKNRAGNLVTDSNLCGGKQSSLNNGLSQSLKSTESDLSSCGKRIYDTSTKLTDSNYNQSNPRIAEIESHCLQIVEKNKDSNEGLDLSSKPSVPDKNESILSVKDTIITSSEKVFDKTVERNGDSLREENPGTDYADQNVDDKYAEDDQNEENQGTDGETHVVVIDESCIKNNGKARRPTFGTDNDKGRGYNNSPITHKRGNVRPKTSTGVYIPARKTNNSTHENNTDTAFTNNEGNATNIENNNAEIDQSAKNSETVSNEDRAISKSVRRVSEWIVFRDYKTTGRGGYGEKYNVWTKSNSKPSHEGKIDVNNDEVPTNVSMLERQHFSQTNSVHPPDSSKRATTISNNPNRLKSDRKTKIVCHDNTNNNTDTTITTTNNNNNNNDSRKMKTSDEDKNQSNGNQNNNNNNNKMSVHFKEAELLNHPALSTTPSKLYWKFTDTANPRNKTFNANRFIPNRASLNETHQWRPSSRDSNGRVLQWNQEVLPGSRPQSRTKPRSIIYKDHVVHCNSSNIRLGYRRIGSAGLLSDNVNSNKAQYYHGESFSFVQQFRPISRESVNQSKQQLQSAANSRPLSQQTTRKSGQKNYSTAAEAKTKSANDDLAETTPIEMLKANKLDPETKQEMLDYFWSYQVMSRQMLGAKWPAENRKATSKDKPVTMDTTVTGAGNKHASGEKCEFNHKERAKEEVKGQCSDRKEEDVTLSRRSYPEHGKDYDDITSLAYDKKKKHLVVKLPDTECSVGDV